MVRERINTPITYTNSERGGIFNVPTPARPCLMIPLWDWLARLLKWLHIPVVE
jgi:hypothetical protein